MEFQIEDEKYYEQKYLKYKLKYLTLKEEYIGGRELENKEIIDYLKKEIDENSKNPKFSKYFNLTEEDKKKKSMYEKLMKKNTPTPTIEKIHKIIDDEYKSTKEGTNIDNGYKLSNAGGFYRFLRNIITKVKENKYLNSNKENINDETGNHVYLKILYDKLKYILYFDEFKENEFKKIYDVTNTYNNLFDEDKRTVYNYLIDTKKILKHIKK
jgi:hypothetical protein